jgi:hypothetical protein
MSLQALERRSQKRSVGKMTAAMRAVAVDTAHNALRVATVVDGRIVEERLFRDPRSGVLDDAQWFERRGDAYWLNVPSGATGRIVSDAGIVEIGPLAMRVRLDESARGRIVCGKATTLFQFVVPPPRPSKAQLPLATRRPEIDWALTVIVAFSFLVHFGVIGSMFSDWLDPVVEPDDAAVVRLVDMTRPTTESPVVEETITTSNEHVTAGTTAPSTASHNAAQQPSAEAQRASLMHDAATMEMDLLRAFNGASTLEGARRRSEETFENLDEVARDARGADTARGDLKLADGRLTAPGPTDLRKLGVTTGGDLRDGRTREVVGPKVDVTTIVDAVPTLPGLEGAVAQLRPSFRSCYVRKGLSDDPSMEGKLTIELQVAPNGEVSDVTRIDGAGLSTKVEQCIIDRAKLAKFDANGTGARARIPIIFRQQR